MNDRPPTRGAVYNPDTGQWETAIPPRESGPRPVADHYSPDFDRTSPIRVPPVELPRTHTPPQAAASRKPWVWVGAALLAVVIVLSVGLALAQPGSSDAGPRPESAGTPESLSTSSCQFDRAEAAQLMGYPVDQVFTVETRKLGSGWECDYGWQRGDASVVLTVSYTDDSGTNSLDSQRQVAEMSEPVKKEPLYGPEAFSTKIGRSPGNPSFFTVDFRHDGYACYAMAHASSKSRMSDAELRSIVDRTVQTWLGIA